ncbi:FMN-binding negative transcriptional regulator [Nocardioides jiangxiensis]|uniref:FMN-binding negative transcriptional regulator n=1 Tax=Nocardioides jiangxiensis TaxID=3064524 RepID=A0ABT9B058_9ACTN|nr:FMN-binding negative transcriptional regulator [Nocardioides sp. WY-20]MDO7868226.1 FMN-binding negative transcriptional regulator [Nocardioides sp. WY-20]
MLVHPWDAALEPAEWQAWLASRDRFGLLAVNNSDPAQAPVTVPTHFTVSGDELVLHLARPNPVWSHLAASTEVRLTVIGDYAFVPSYWRAGEGTPEEEGVPTSYYASVQFVCTPTVVDDPAGKAAILTAQMDDLQPEGRHAAVSTEEAPYARMLPGIRGLRLTPVRVEAKFKYDDHKPAALREDVAQRLEERGTGLDRAAARQQRRRLAEAGEWEKRRSGHA